VRALAVLMADPQIVTFVGGPLHGHTIELGPDHIRIVVAPAGAVGRTSASYQRRLVPVPPGLDLGRRGRRAADAWFTDSRLRVVTAQLRITGKPEGPEAGYAYQTALLEDLRAQAKALWTSGAPVRFELLDESMTVSQAEGDRNWMLVAEAYARPVEAAPDEAAK
jgi:hypothetical protein